MAKRNNIIKLNIQNKCVEMFFPIKKEEPVEIKIALNEYIDKDLFEIFNYAIKQGLEKTQGKVLESNQVIVVLPNRYIGTDFITLPNMSKSQLVDSLKLYVRKAYKNVNDLQIKTELCKTTNDKFFYQICYVQRKFLDEIFRACTTENKFIVRDVTFDSCAGADALLYYQPKLRKADFMFVDMFEKYSNVSIINADKLMAFTTLNFGYSALKKNRINFLDTNNSETSIKVVEQDAIKNNYKGDMTYRSNYKYFKMNNKEKPTEQGEILKTNFNIVMKELLEIYNHFQSDEVVENLDSIVINIPNEYNEVIANFKQDNPDIQIVTNEVRDKYNNIFENLNLYGANYIEFFNKNKSF